MSNKTADSREMECMVKLNDKVFTIIGKIPGRFMDAVCPNGKCCKIEPNLQYILHRDENGKIQSEPVN